MLIQDVMQTKLFTVTPEATLPEALRLTGQRGVRHLPVLDGDRLVGILSDRDLKRAMASPATSLEAHELNYLLDRLRVEEIMTRKVITIGRMFPIEAAASVMVREKIGALPVTDDARLVGLVTETDVLRLFVRALGAGEPSSRLDVDLGDRPHALAEAVQTVEASGADISIGTAGTPIAPDLRAAAARHPEATLARWLRYPSAQEPTRHMPNLQLTAAEANALAAYLASLR